MTDAPTGTVTFLFTDIQGSTQLWESHPDQMALALERHDLLLSEAIRKHQGHVFKTVGDAFCAAFANAGEGLEAAIDAQKAIADEPWPEPISIRVRMALHTGSCVIRNGDYFGRTLNRVARLLSTGHGGQILLSGATWALVKNSPPVGVGLHGLGEHRLRDLGSPENVFQVTHPTLSFSFPPLKSLDNPDLPNNLPRLLTSFIGREREIEEVGQLLKSSRLLALTGTGGSGKTRLALQVGADALESNADGVWFVELASLSDKGLVTPSVAQVLKLSESPGQPLDQTLIQFIGEKRLLLILDNCEHLLPVCAVLASNLLRDCPNLKVLVTSREPLGVRGEQTYRVPSLTLPKPGATLSVKSIVECEAVRLFTERAQLVKSDFAVTPKNARALAQVCARLDGIPLAIELASARVRSMPVEEIDARLDNRFRLLTGGDRSGLPRHQTLRALIDWSYELLSDAEKGLLRKLSVFSGGWTLDEAEILAEDGEMESWEVLDHLTSLVDKSLVIAEEDQGAARYRLLETVRQYAAERAVDSGESEAIKAKHAEIFLRLVEEAEPELRGPDQDKWLNRLEREHDNIRTALGWCKQSADGAHWGIRLAGSLHRFWSIRGYLSEGREHLTSATERADPERPTIADADALLGLGRLAWFQADYATARPLFEQGLSLHRQLENKSGIAYTLLNLANVACYQGDYGTAKQMNEDSLALFRELGDRFGVASALGNLGNVASDQGENIAAWPLYEECRSIQKELGNKYGYAVATHNLGLAAFNRAEYQLARSLFEECLAIYRELGYKSGTASMLANLGNIALDHADNTGAKQLFSECLRLRRELGDKRGIASGLEAIGVVLASESGYERSARLWGAVHELRETTGMPRTSGENERHDLQLTQARTALGEEGFAVAWEEGRRLSWEDAVELAMEEKPD